MGRKGSGVEVREKSIRISFALDGKPHKHTIMTNGAPAAPTPANIKFAHRLAAEIRERIRHGTFSLAEYFPAAGSSGVTITVGAQLDTWLSAQRIEASTRSGFDSVVRFWKAELGDKPLRSLKHSDVLAALARHPGLSGKTINNRTSVLRGALKLAVLDKLLTESPVAGMRSARWQRPDVDPFTADEVEQILGATKDDAVRNYLEFRFFTGLRSGESFGLRWRNVDLPAGHIVVSESIVSGVEKGTKTGQSRTVLLNSRAARALQAQKALTYLAGQHVFLNPATGGPWTERGLRDHWVGVLKRLGIRHRRQYNTRHTYATRMLMTGLKPAFCAGQMGHSVEMFLRVYSKWIPGAGDAAEMAKLEASMADSPRILPRVAGN